MPAKDRARRRALPRQQRARETVEVILEAAELVLGDVGYERATTNRIAQRAGVNVSLLYRYFAGREALVAALVERAIDVTERAIAEAVGEGRAQPLRPALRLVLHAAMTHPSPSIHRVLFEHIDEARRRPLLDALRVRLRTQLGALIAAHARELRDVDDEATLFLLMHLMESGAHAAVFYRPVGVSAERALDALTDLVARAIEVKRRTRSSR